MRRRRATIPQRRRIFLGCEGESEQGYGALLSRIAEGMNLHLAIQSVLLRPGGGDPLDLVSLAIELSERDERRRGAFAFKAALLDCDKLGVSPDRDRSRLQWSISSISSGRTLRMRLCCSVIWMAVRLSGLSSLRSRYRN
jgi:hypothetical protein